MNRAMGMRRRVVEISQQVLFVLNILIAFFLIFERYLEIPAWLQIVGRMHPLFLHFPIVILLLAIALDLVLPRPGDEAPFRKTLLDAFFLLGSVAASLTVIMGLFLSREEATLSSALQLHKWMGVGVAAIACAIVYLRSLQSQMKNLLRGSYLVITATLLTAGHLGSELTHGENFLLGPLRPGEEKVAVAREEARLFDHVIKPVLEARCMTCHNERKAKGELIMLDSVHLEEGGKNGAPFLRGDPLQSLMIQRINLPVEHKEHMPPKGKPQLTDEERQLLFFWIRSGAPYSKRVMAFSETDTLRRLAENVLGPPVRQTERIFTFTAAREKDIQSLQTDYRVIYPLAFQSPALRVNFYNRSSFSADALRDLQKISKQVVSLDLNKMPVRDEDLKTIAMFENLEELSLNFTAITGAGLKQLAPLQSLTELSLSGTRVTTESLDGLAVLRGLRSVYLWQTEVRPEEIGLLQKTLPGVAIEIGFRDDGEMLKLNLPRIDNKLTIFSDSLYLTLSHPIRDTQIRFTLDGSDPDSIHGQVYEAPVKVNIPVTLVKSRAYKKGWIGSDIISRYFLKSAYKPDSIALLTLPDPEYLANGAHILADGQTNNNDFRSGNWLGYRANDAEVLFCFERPVRASSLTLSMLKNTPSYIFPPAEVELWGTDGGGPMALLGRWHPAQPDSLGSAAIEVAEFDFEPKVVTRLKIISRPLRRLPSWHPAKGEKGWLFLDEILVN
jgi:uncharacterized membrane protein